MTTLPSERQEQYPNRLHIRLFLFTFPTRITEVNRIRGFKKTINYTLMYFYTNISQIPNLNRKIELEIYLRVKSFLVLNDESENT